MATKRKKRLYPEYSDKVNSTMASVVDFVSDKNGGKMPAKDTMMMDKLADLLHLYEQIKDYNLEHGIVAIDRFGQAKKSEFLKAQTETFVQIMKIAASFGLTLKDDRHLHEVDADGDTLMGMIEALNGDE